MNTKEYFWIKKIIWLFGILFIFMNVIAAFHAYKFTHFASEHNEKTRDAKQLSEFQKFTTLVFGISNPRPANKTHPDSNYQLVSLKSNRNLEAWHIRKENAKGTIIICHGFGGCKASMLDKADVFGQMGYDTFLIDFMGSGGSEGNQTTIGFLEAEQVKTAFEYIQEKEKKPIYLFGTSMGAVAIMKALHDFKLQPQGILIECPFGSMYQTVCARFQTMNMPSFPMADLLVFWGGVMNGFWAFDHNPSEYAKRIKCPTLLLHGGNDDKVSQKESDVVYQNLIGPKRLKIFPEAGHENYLRQYRNEWTNEVLNFLVQTNELTLEH